MDVFSSFFSSQSSLRNRWSYDSLKNLGQISPAVQTHLTGKRIVKPPKMTKEMDADRVISTWPPINTRR
ncbi:hypothetical protein FH972_026982 [Carpinus fangiana]|uniref:Uncharacterized protein n=1 Tax=Carpinus fangiana TaxID=176857 RepID=A0A5N6L5N2_9ROSI|nr:hypothetical protein FH972_026982 [Carpinus fangiana]